VVVQLSQCAVSEKHKYSHLQKRLDAYAQLVREQDRMIEELKALNSRLVKEKEALLSFRREGDEGEEEAWLAAGGSAAEAATGQQTPKSKEFAASLVAQLRDEKRQRLAVEEQSSRMIGEQQVTIHRLEEKLKQSAVSHVSPHRNSHGAARQAAQSPGSRPLPNRPIVPAVHVAPAQSQDSAAPVGAAGRGGTAVSASESLAAGSAKAADSAADRHLASSFTPLFSGGTTSTLTSMEDATAILQQIRRRHGL
jgi:hypothetical protein